MALDAGHALDAGQAEERRVRRANAIRAVAQGVADTPFADGHGSQAAASRPRKLLVDPRHGPRLTTLRLPRNAGLRYEASSICARSWQVSSRGLLGAAMPTAIGTLIPTTGGMTLANVVGTKGKDLVLEALLLCRPSGRVSLADALVWAAARSQANASVYSPDGRFPDEGVRVLRSIGGGSC